MYRFTWRAFGGSSGSLQRHSVSHSALRLPEASAIFVLKHVDVNIAKVFLRVARMRDYRTIRCCKIGDHKLLDDIVSFNVEKSDYQWSVCSAQAVKNGCRKMQLKSFGHGESDLDRLSKQNFKKRH